MSVLRCSPKKYAAVLFFLISCKTVRKTLPINLIKMDTSKKTPEQEREIRFNAWKENVSKEIDEQAELISSVIAAISNPEISVESKKSFLRIGANAVAQYDNLSRIYSDALTVRTLSK